MLLSSLGLVGFFLGGVAFSFQSSRLLGVLLCLEGLTLMVLLCSMSFAPLLFMSLAVFESALGLALLSTLARTMGSDKVCTSE